MKKIFASLFIAVAALALYSCGNANTPSGVVEKAIKCIQNEDYEGYIDLLFNDPEDAKSEEEVKEMKTVLSGKIKASMEKQQGIKSYKIVSEELSENGNEAVVTVKIEYGNGKGEEDKMKVRKGKDGKWRIVLGK